MSTISGYGLFAAEDIEKGRTVIGQSQLGVDYSSIAEYVGEIIEQSEADKRGQVVQP